MYEGIRKYGKRINLIKKIVPSRSKDALSCKIYKLRSQWSKAQPTEDLKDVHDIITGVKVVEVDSEKETTELILEAFLQYGHDFDKICDEVGKCNHIYVTKFLEFRPSSHIKIHQAHSFAIVK